MKHPLRIGRLALFAALALFIVAVSTAHAETHVFVQFGGPAGVPMPPAYGMVWSPGHYAWTQYGSVWVPGEWVRSEYVRPYRSWRRDWDRDEYRERRDWDRDRRWDRDRDRDHDRDRDRDRWQR